MMYTKLLGLLLAAFIVTGCADKGTTDASKTETTPKPEKQNAAASTEEHAPHGSGPNGGVVFDLGKYHAEFTVDHPKHECMILFIGNDEKNAGSGYSERSDANH